MTLLIKSLFLDMQVPTTCTSLQVSRLINGSTNYDNVNSERDFINNVISSTLDI